VALKYSIFGVLAVITTFVVVYFVFRGSRLEVQNETVIDAPVEDVWKVLTDFDLYSEWNPFLINASVEPRVGGKTRFISDIPEVGHMKHDGVVTVMNKNSEFTFQVTTLHESIGMADHTMILVPLPNKQSKLIHKEIFKGTLIGVTRFMPVGDRAIKGFRLMDQALKERVEGGIN